jgi:AcrR family transcriptional regulator
VQGHRNGGYRRHVSKSKKTAEKTAPAGLSRLPPGRHGLDRTFVAENQRNRLTAGIIDVVARRGYHDATVAGICAAAGMSRRTFYSYFSSKEECYLEAFDSITDYLGSAMGAAGLGESGWPARVRARMAAVLEVFATNPDLARFVLLAPVRAGEGIVDRHRVVLEQILQALTHDRPSGGRIRQPSPVTEQALLGGVMALIAQRVDEGEGEGLADLLPDLVELFLAPYLGRKEAARVAATSPA